MRRHVSILLAGTLALTACGGSGSTGTTASKDATSTSTAQGVATTTSAKTKTIDAAQVLAGLKSKMSSITESIVYTADSQNS